VHKNLGREDTYSYILGRLPGLGISVIYFSRGVRTQHEDAFDYNELICVTVSKLAMQGLINAKDVYIGRYGHTRITSTNIPKDKFAAICVFRFLL
jgi:hypothetical protein